MTVYDDVRPRLEVKEVIGEKSLCIVANEYADWGEKKGTHLVVRALCKSLNVDYVLSKADPKGWVVVGVPPQEVMRNLKDLCAKSWPPSGNSSTASSRRSVSSSLRVRCSS